LVAFRGAIHPLGATKNGDRKVLDVGVEHAVEDSSGNKNDNGTKAATIHGPYVEVGTYALRLPIGETYGFRAGVNGSVDGLFREDSNNAGLGLSAGPIVKFTGNATGP
jgi:hypothetical protein